VFRKNIARNSVLRLTWLCYVLSAFGLFAQQGPRPLVSKGHPVNWWFVFKLNAKSFPACGGGTRSCPFGGDVQTTSTYSNFGQQFVFASSDSPTLQSGPTDCLGTTDNDPVGATFDEVYNGRFFYVVWNDQFYGDPSIGACTSNGSCASPWGHSKGIVAWNDAGEGLVIQVSTPSWPASGSALHPRKSDGNTLGCVKDNNVTFSQHFFALRLTKADLVDVLNGMRNASVVTDPNNLQVVNNGGPSDIQDLVRQLGTKVASGDVLTTTLSSGVGFISKPSGLHVPPWQMVSSILSGTPLRVANFWANPKIPSTTASTSVDCWDPSLKSNPGAVEIATIGTWNQTSFDLTGAPGGNHAKVGVSTGTQPISIFGDLNQQGALNGNCSSAQNGRGGMFFAIQNPDLWKSLSALLNPGVSLAQPPLAPPVTQSSEQQPTSSSRFFDWIRDNRAVLISALLCFALLVVPMVHEWSEYKRKRREKDKLSAIEELVASDSPVTKIEQDALGQAELVTRLSKFLRNPSTMPPIVLALQAPWGMGKTSVMRMLESDLKRNRAALCVWFNAWHYQREDLLLAYLLEAIQKNAVPPWMSLVGLRVRFDLLRLRLFSGRDRLALICLCLSFCTFWLLRRNQLKLLSASRSTFAQWALSHAPWLAGGAAALALLQLLQNVRAFRSNPEKLAEKTGGMIVDTLKELVRMPSLIGKSDVREEFAQNLNDLVKALEPQRLVIFLDDLDRCRSEQVVQILEAVNFLSSAAPCIVILGADYRKVETLVAAQFEKIAANEAENAGVIGGDPIALRLAYGRKYLKKIINLRLNLRPLTEIGVSAMVAGEHAGAPLPRRVLSRIAAALTMVAPILVAAAIAHWIFPLQRAQNSVLPQPEVSQAVNATGVTQNLSLKPVQGTTASAGTPTMEVPSGLTRLRSLLVYGSPTILLVVVGIYWFSRPKHIEEARDSDEFSKALRDQAEEIFERNPSPREVRRFLNYLRLVATEARVMGKESLRGKYPKTFDRNLVDLASTGETSQTAGPDERSEMIAFFEEQCLRFGLDPKTFSPEEVDRG
jgi:hypothetical protein